eukprot:4814637-Alexandrium_andersonii.AAC.1
MPTRASEKPAPGKTAIKWLANCGFLRMSHVAAAKAACCQVAPVALASPASCLRCSPVHLSHIIQRQAFRRECNLLALSQSME